jgi:hypothetical protein
MPKGVVKNTTKRKSKKAESAERNNKAVVSDVLEKGKIDDYEFARVEANLGSGGFRIILNSGKQCIGVPRKLFTAGSMAIRKDDIVICSAPTCNQEAKVQSLQIVGLLSRKDAHTLWKGGKISRQVWLTNPDDEVEDDFFEHADEEVDSEVDVDKI